MNRLPVRSMCSYQYFTRKILNTVTLSYNFYCRCHYQLCTQLFFQRTTQVTKPNICHHCSNMSFHIGPMFKHVIQVQVPIWFPLQVQIFVKHITQVPNHYFCNHFILLSFLSTFVLYIHNLPKKISIYYLLPIFLVRILCC